MEVRVSMLHPLEPDEESEEDMRPYPFKSREFMLSELRLNESNFVVKSGGSDFSGRS